MKKKKMNKNFDQTISSINNHQILSPLVKKEKKNNHQILN